MTVTMRTDSDTILLWGEYQSTKSTDLRNRLVEAHLDLVKRVVSGMLGKTFTKYVGYDEIVAAGNFGLIQAVEGFDIDRGIRFETYAPTRIRGAILDWLREIDWIPRKVRSNARLYQNTVSGLQNELDRHPTLQEVADYLHIPLDDAVGLEQDADGADTRFQQEGEQVRGNDDTYGKMPALDQMPGKGSSTPLDELTREDGFDELLTCLTEKEQIIITLYYRDSFTMIQIGNVLGLSESRISQTHDTALLKIKDSFL